MMLFRRRFLQLAAGVAILPASSRLVRAQTYPTRPVRAIVPFGPGGPTDVTARLIAQKLSEHLGKQVYVENLPGAGSNIGTAQAARAAPDGHTILITVNNYVINPSLYKKVAYDPAKDFAPVTLAARFDPLRTPYVGRTMPPAPTDRPIVLASNRGPVSFVRSDDGGLTSKRGAGGLVRSVRY